METRDQDQLRQFKLKRLIKNLQNAQGSGTSMISVIIPPGKKVSDIQKMLTDEAGKAERIKDRANRQGVIRAINSVKEKLKMIGKIPRNGLFVYSGEIMARNGKSTTKMVVSFEPFKPINTSLYKCGSEFETKELKKLMIESDKYGFIIVDGLGTLYGTIQGNHKDVLQKFSVDLPKKHGRGGQSSQRFQRIRLEKRAAYVKKVIEGAVNCFIANDVPTVAGIVVAGYADFKTRVAESQFMDPRLKSIIVSHCDISYGGEQGFNQAIDLSKASLHNLKLVQEQELIGKFYEEINLDTGKIVYGIRDTMKCLEESVIERFLVWDNLETIRVVVKNKDTEEPEIKYFSPEEYEQMDATEGFDVLEEEDLVDWLAENVGGYGTELEFVTDQSPEGSQFVKGFGGVGGFLRFKYEFDEMEYGYYDDDDDDDGFI